MVDTFISGAMKRIRACPSGNNGVARWLAHRSKKCQCLLPLLLSWVSSFSDWGGMPFIVDQHWASPKDDTSKPLALRSPPRWQLRLEV
jgi:hypothetical protein